WDALRMNMMISYQELVRTFLRSDRLNDVAHGFYFFLCRASVTVSPISAFSVVLFTPGFEFPSFHGFYHRLHCDL
ncbi:hypothetical protein, partial [Pseudaeromonas pectinilytica]